MDGAICLTRAPSKQYFRRCPSIVAQWKLRVRYIGTESESLPDYQSDVETAPMSISCNDTRTILSSKASPAAQRLDSSTMEETSSRWGIRLGMDASG